MSINLGMPNSQSMRFFEDNALNIDPGQTAPMAFVETERECIHCGTKTNGSICDPSGRVYCCTGCAAAYSLIHAEGLEEYYRLRGFWDNAPNPAAGEIGAGALAALDDPNFLPRYANPIGAGEWSLTFRLAGIHCAACIWLLEKLPRILPGVTSARASLSRNAISVTLNPARVSVSQIAKTICQLGYTPSVDVGSATRSIIRQRNREQLVQIAIAGACAGNVMLLALGIYAGEASGMAVQHLTLLRGTSIVIGLACLLGPGAVFFRGAWSALGSRTPHMDIPIALGLGVGAVSGAVSGITGVGELYFDSLCMLVFLLLVGRAIQSSQQQSSCEAVDILRSILPPAARRIVNGVTEQVLADSLTRGDTVEILPGEKVPADGKVISGNSEVDQAWLTGESMPVAIGPGAMIAAGTHNVTSTLRMVVEACGGDTRAGRIAKTIQDSSFAKSPLIQLADRIAGLFVIVVMVLASLTAIGWYFVDARAVPDRVIALLIVACPCALGLATPLVVARVMGLAAKRDMLIKGAEVFHRLVKPGVIWFDKTGTLTCGEHEVVEHTLDSATLMAVAQLEQHTKHPIGKAIGRAAKSLAREEAQGSDELYRAVENIRVVPGKGLIGIWAGRELAVGNRLLMNTVGCRLGGEWESKLNLAIRDGRTIVLVAVETQLVGYIALRDRIRAEAAGVVQSLQSAGWQVGILSGDHRTVVESVGQQLGIATEYCRSEMLPEQKQQTIVDCRQQLSHRVNEEKQFRLKKRDRTSTWVGTGAVVMVGDGVNDAAALAAADVGIAVAGGAEVSMDAADVYLRRAELRGILDLIGAAKRTQQVAMRNFMASLGYNLFAVGLAMVGWIHPLIAAILMPISSLTVVSVTMSARFFK